jgi:hypothetical protein
MLLCARVLQNQSPSHVTVRLCCPKCRRLGTLDPLGQHDIVVGDKQFEYILGHRRCPDPLCHTHVFVVCRTSDHQLLTSYPPELVDFDNAEVPQPVVKAFEEAISCYAQHCYVAAAIMVRKTLEELCRDRQATGQNLRDRIRSLHDKVVLPGELLDGIDDLRLLGNDAAHVESQSYNQVGEAELDAAIGFTKEVLKATYQYKALLAQLKALQKAP